MPRELSRSRVETIMSAFDHRPWPMPTNRWQMFMRWSELAFLHWPVPAEALRGLVPSPLELDTFEASAWVGVVPFRMSDTRFRGLLGMPTATTFPEINVRTYVRHRDFAGVWFFSLDAASWLAVLGGRIGLNLPYFHARMSIDSFGDEVRYRSRRIHRGAAAAEFRGSYCPVEPVQHSNVGSIEHWLTERYCLFSQSRRGRISRLDVHHLPWPLQKAQADIEENSMAAASRIRLPDIPPLVHYASGVDVVAWGAVSIKA